MTVVQSQITSIRDEIQRRRSAATGGALGYAADPWPGDEQALGYAASKSSRVRENPLYAKAQPAAPKANEYGLAVWGQGFGDYEERTGTFNGTDIGRITRTWGFIGGIDKTFTNLNTASDALVLGLLSGDVTAGVDTKIGSAARITGPSVGVYGIYVNGGFATDLTFKADFFGVDQMQAGSSTTSLGLDNYTVAFNLNYKSDLNRSWWLEPTVGTLHTNTAWNGTAHDLGLTDGDTWRVQGGARLGWNTVWNTVQVDSTLAALAYDDVSIRGGTISTVAAPLVPTDEGKVFGQLIGKLNFDYGNGLSSYLEGEVRGREGVFGAEAAHKLVKLAILSGLRSPVVQIPTGISGPVDVGGVGPLQCRPHPIIEYSVTLAAIGSQVAITHIFVAVAGPQKTFKSEHRLAIRLQMAMPQILVAAAEHLWLGGSCGFPSCRAKCRRRSAPANSCSGYWAERG